MTEQEQIEEMRSNIYYARSKVNGIATSNDIAEALYSIGYRKVPDGAVVLTPEERDDEMKATNEILAERDDLIAKVGVLGGENYDLKAENEELKVKLNARLTCDFVKKAQKHAKIDVLNKAKERIKTAIDTYFNKDGGGYYLAEDAIDDIDELLREYE